METAIRRYTVTFDLNYTDATNPPKPQEIDAGGKVTPPAAPTRTDGYFFEGWFTQASGGTEYDFDSPVTADIALYARWKPITFAAVIADMAADAAANSTSANYTLPSGSETYTTALNLTTANSPASVTIDGGGRVVTGSANSITVEAGITLTLKNISFTTLPLTVAASGTLVLDNGAVVQGNAGTGITVNGGTL
jgi:uncharacterized repeat protein (TIGR02543 family)